MIEVWSKAVGALGVNLGAIGAEPPPLLGKDAPADALPPLSAELMDAIACAPAAIYEAIDNPAEIVFINWNGAAAIIPYSTAALAFDI